MARYLGKVGFGQFSFAIAFTAFFFLFGDLGLSYVTTRDLARQREKAGKYLGNILLMKFLLCLFAFSLIIISINLMKYPADVKVLVYILAGYTIFQSYTTFLLSVSNAFERMEIEALLASLLKVFILAGVFWVIRVKLGLSEIAFVYTFSGLIQALAGFLLVFKLFARPQFEIDWKFWRELIKKAIPFAVSGILLVVSTQIGIIMLSKMAGDAAVGLYSAAVRLTSLFLFIPANFSKTLFPVFSRLWQTSRESFIKYYRKSFQYLFIFAIPVGIGGTLLAPRIISLIYGNEYLAAAIILKILVWGLVMQSIATILGIILPAIDKQLTCTKVFFWAMLLNIFLNWILIRQYSYKGAAMATLLTNCFFFLTFFIIISKIITPLNLKRICLRPLLSALFMGGFIYFFRDLNLAVLIFFSGLIYFFLLLVFKALGREDLQLLKSIFVESKL